MTANPEEAAGSLGTPLEIRVAVREKDRWKESGRVFTLRVLSRPMFLAVAVMYQIERYASKRSVVQYELTVCEVGETRSGTTTVMRCGGIRLTRTATGSNRRVPSRAARRGFRRASAGRAVTAERSSSRLPHDERSDLISETLSMFLPLAPSCSQATG